MHSAAGPAVVGAVLAAAVLHATWNAIAHRIADRFVGFVLIGIAAAVIGGVLVALVAAPARASWVFLAVSTTLHVGYELLLLRSFQVGQFGQVYPLARGTSPWLVAITAFVFAGESLSPAQLTGIAVISAGLGTLVLAGGRPRRRDLPAILAAVGTGVFIASYTTVDGLGVRRAHATLGYIGWLFLLQGVVLPIAAVALRGRRLPAQLRPHLGAGLTAGALSVVAYGLVLWAQTRGALAPIAALRETSVIVGALIAAVRFREPLGPQRVIAAVVVVVGVVLISL